MSTATKSNRRRRASDVSVSTEKLQAHREHLLSTMGELERIVALISGLRGIEDVVGRSDAYVDAIQAAKAEFRPLAEAFVYASLGHQEACNLAAKEYEE